MSNNEWKNWVSGAGRVLLATPTLAVLFLLASRASAQTFVTPTVAPTPPGTLIVVNNGPGDHSDPHVSGDLASYSNSDGTNFTQRYFNLATRVDAGIPNTGTFDFLADVRGSVIVFTRVSTSTSSIFAFDTASPSTPPVEIAPQAAGVSRQSPRIGDQTIAWQEFFSASSSDIVAFNRQSGTRTRLANDSALNETPDISPDGTVIVWKKCSSTSFATSPCVPWKAILSNGTWTAQQVISQLLPNSGNSSDSIDTDGSTIAYTGLNSQGVRQLAWQPVGGGTENVLNVPGSQSFPSLSGGLIAFSSLAAGATTHDIALYNVATNTLYNVTGDLARAGLGPGGDNQLNDISLTADGKVRLVWQVQQTHISIYAYTFNLPVGDFNLSPVSPMTISAGGSGSTSVTVNPLNGFSSAVNLSVTGQPNGVSATLSPNSVTPSGGNPVSSVLNVNTPPFLVPTNFTLTVTGNSGTLTHSTTADVTVTATTSSISNLIGDLLSAGCIDNAGIANALTSKLSAAQSAIGVGNIQTAINTLTALKNQINAQAGKHIATSCAIGGVAFNPVTVLLTDVQGLIDSLKVSAIPNPITGYVVNASGVGVSGATLSILDSGGHAVATATTDISGFYFFATTGVLVSGSSYTVAVTGLPAGFATSTPASSPGFTWTGAGMTIGNFVLN